MSSTLLNRICRITNRYVQYFVPISAKKIRLNGTHKGYIEINDGSTWRTVDEKKWDQNRQKLLCKHLGFDESSEDKINGSTRSIEKIATGDFVCYNTQPSGTSCCAYLQPSTTTTTSSIPYVNCKCATCLK